MSCLGLALLGSVSLFAISVSLINCKYFVEQMEMCLLLCFVKGTVSVAKNGNPPGCCTNFINPSVRAACICTVQFAQAFQSVSSGLESFLCGYGFGLQQSWK